MPISSPLVQIAGDALFAARQLQTVEYWVNNFIPGAVQRVLNNGPAAGGQPGIYYTLNRGERVIVVGMHYGVLTVNDNCIFELGWTDTPNAAGVFMPATSARYVFTGGAIAGRATFVHDRAIPVCLRYVDGVRSITFRVTANDATCAIVCAWSGWIEQDDVY